MAGPEVKEGYARLPTEPVDDGNFSAENDVEKASAQLSPLAYGTFLKSDENMDLEITFRPLQGVTGNIALSLLASLLVVGAFTIAAFFLVSMLLG